MDFKEHVNKFKKIIKDNPGFRVSASYGGVFLYKPSDNDIIWDDTYHFAVRNDPALEHSLRKLDLKRIDVSPFGTRGYNLKVSRNRVRINYGSDFCHGDVSFRALNRLNLHPFLVDPSLDVSERVDQFHREYMEEVGFDKMVGDGRRELGVVYFVRDNEVVGVFSKGGLDNAFNSATMHRRWEIWRTHHPQSMKYLTPWSVPNQLKF